MTNIAKQRINWVDQLKGFSIILVVYGHNLPIVDIYIDSFRIPLFFLIAGFFHPKEASFTLKTIKKRSKQILIPYFFWSLLLFIFWFFIGRKYGDSVNLDLSVTKNFLGIFFAQGGHEYMNWGITMWFLPSIFLSFIFFGMVRKLKKISNQIILLFFLIVIGFSISKMFNINLFWSLDVSLVSLLFYSLGFYSRDFLFKNDSIKYESIYLILLLIIYTICAINFSENVDMFRSKYGNIFFFIINAITGICFWILFFRKLNNIKILTFFGKNTIPVLALHIRALTFIKLFLLIFWSSKSFNFNEIEKILLVFIQLALLYPIILIINKYAPILNGKIKAKARN